MNKNVLILGIPRCGSTWVSEVIAIPNNFDLLHEPDNEKNRIVARLYKKSIHRFYTDEDFEKKEIYTFWDNFLIYNKKFRSYINLYDIIYKRLVKNKERAISGKKYNKKESKFLFQPFLFSNNNNTTIVKSVHGLFALEKFINRYNNKIIVVIRHPANVYQSYLRLNMNDANRLFGDENFFIKYCTNEEFDSIKKMNYKEKVISQIAIQYRHLFKIKDKYQGKVYVVSHEELCIDNLLFKEIYDFLDIKWSSNAEKYINGKNQVGTRFTTNRLSSELPDLYKRNITVNDIELIKERYKCIESSNFFKWD